ncbi:MAG: DegV family protein [Acidobacteriota bacterium]
MERQTLLVIDAQEERRRALATGLSELAYEVIPAVTLDQGRAFAAGLDPQVLVLAGAPAEPPESYADLLARAETPGITVLFLAATPAQEAAAPDRTLILPLAVAAPALLLERVRLLLLGRELLLDADVEQGALVGDVSRWPFFALLPRLEGAKARGRLVLPAGEIVLDRGEVASARAGQATGLKAFCRLAAPRAEGIFRFYPESTPPERSIDLPTRELLARAIEDSLGEAPDPRTRIELKLGRALFDATLTPLQREILSIVGEGILVGRLLDGLAAPDGEIAREIRSLEARGLVEVRLFRERVAIVTDSSADLPYAVLKREGIHLVPLSVIFGHQTYRDAVDLTPRQFYDLLSSRSSHPSTQPPSVEDFAAQYRRLRGASHVLSIHLSRKMSLTEEHAALAAQAIEREEPDGIDPPLPTIRAIDSEQASLPLGLLVLFAARLAQRGLAVEDIAHRIEGMRRRLHAHFVVDTLEFLARGGRIGRAQAMMGKLLGIKPILGLSEGEVGPVDRVRGGRAAQRKMVDLLKKKVDPRRPVIAGVAHAAAPLWAERLEAILRAEFQIADFLLAEMGPIVGTHVGPGTVGAVVFQPSAEELELLLPVS